MKFTVKLAVTFHKELDVSGADEDEASENAVDIVMKWANVEDAEVVEVTPHDI